MRAWGEVDFEYQNSTDVVWLSGHQSAVLCAQTFSTIYACSIDERCTVTYQLDHATLDSPPPASSRPGYEMHAR